MIRVVCTCGSAFKAEDRHAGRQANCPVCGASLTIPTAPGAGRGSGSSGGDEGSAAWSPGDPSYGGDRATAPTRSATDPGLDPVVPRRSDDQARLRGPGQPPAGAAAGPMGAAAPGGPALPAATRRAIIGGSAAAAGMVLAVGAFLWLRPANPGAGGTAPAPSAIDAGPPGAASKGGPPPSTGPGRRDGAPEERVVTAPAGAGATTPPSGRPEDAGRLKAAAGRRLRLLVPAYIYPAGDGRKEWQRLLDAASKVEIVVIANPNSGPGEGRDLEYAAMFTAAGKRRLTVVGYVSTDFGKRPPSDIKKDIDRWVEFYPQIRGFFFDAQPREDLHVAAFAELREYAGRKLTDPLVITNPGVPCDEAYLAKNVSNVTCIFVNYQGFEPFWLPTALNSYEPSRFAAMPYDVPDAESMRSFLNAAIVKGIGYIYISDAKPPNRWDKLPAYWEAEVEAISQGH